MPLFLKTRATPEIPPWFDSIQRLPVKTVRVAGHRIAYLDAGAGPAVILIHGFSASMWHWEYQQAALSIGHRVITPDLLGSGLSDKPDIRYAPEEFLGFLHEFMDALGIKRAALVGNSMGAGLTIGMALTHPKQVDRLVLIAGLPDRIHEQLASPLIKRLLDSKMPVWLVELGNRLSGRAPTRVFLRELVHDSTLLTSAVIDRSYRNRKRPRALAPLLAVGKNLALWEKEFASRIGEIRHPVLILWGAEDKVFPPHVGRQLHAAIAGSVFELIPKAGHICQWEKPDIVNPIILKFLLP